MLRNMTKSMREASPQRICRENGILSPKKHQILGVVLPHLPGEIFRATLVNFIRLFPHSLVNFHRISVSYSLFS